MPTTACGFPTSPERSHAKRTAARGRCRSKPLLLDGWTWCGAIAAEHAAVAFLRLQPRRATGAVIEVQTVVGGHDLGRPVAARWTGDGRSQLDHGLTFARSQENLQGGKPQRSC